MRQRSGATVIARDGAARAGMTVPNAILQLQATVGNRAVGRMLGRLPVQRLWDAEAFKEQTDAGFGVLRGTTLKAIDGLLARYNDPDGLDMNRKLMTATLSDLNRAAMILEHVIEDTRIWMNNHEDDTSRDRHRMVGIRQLNLDATQERAAVENRRAAKAAENNWVPLPIKASDEVNHIREKFENVSAKSALEKLSFLIDLAVPDIGSKGEVEAMVDIPVEPSGVGFIGFRFKAAAERSERNKMKVRMEVSLTGGAQIGGDLMRVAAEIGGYLEAAGQDSKQVMQAISYGLYRKFRESQVLPRGAANFIWGGTTSTAIGYKQSEKWSAQVEKELFGKNKDAYVEMGAMGGASIESGISGVGKGKLAAQVGGGTRWNKDSIADIAKAKGQWDDASIDALGDEVVKLSQAGKTPLLENKEFLEVLVAMGWKKSRVWQLAKKADKSGDYSKNGIVAVAKKLSDSRGRAALGETHKYSAVGGAQKSRGEHTAYMQVTGDLDIGPATLGAKLDMSWTSKGRDKMRASHFREGKLEVKGGLKLPMAKALGGEWLLMLVGEKSINALNQMSRAPARKSPR